MKPTTPQQIEATIAVVRAAAAGDPLDDSHTLRGHLAMVLGALDEARRERDEARASAIRVGEECDAALRSLGRTQTALDEERRVCTKALAERDEARAALAKAERERDDLSRAIEDTLPEVRALREASRTEPARIAAAEMARDVAWVRKVARSVDRTPAIEAIARALDLSPLGGVKVYMADQSDADIAAAIRAARGQS